MGLNRSQGHDTLLYIKPIFFIVSLICKCASLTLAVCPLLIVRLALH